VTSALRAIYRYFAALIFLAIIVQVFLAGLGAFAVSEEASAVPWSMTLYVSGSRLFHHS
jgi:hypothetical protein